MDFDRKRPERSALGVHVVDILRIKFRATTMRLAEKIIFQGALYLLPGWSEVVTDDGNT